jgi:tetratricopeptide (TPR) repeat protein
VSQHVVRDLDAWRDDWAARWLDACREPDEVFDLRMACLREARAAFATATEVLAAADARVAATATSVVDELPSPARCNDAAALRAEAPPPDDPALARAVAAAREALARAAARRSAGAYREGLDAALELRATSTALQHAPLQAEVELEIARGHWPMGDYDAAATELRHAVALGLRSGARDVAARAAAGELFVVGYLQDRPAEALRLRDLAIALARERPDADALESTARTHLGRVLLRGGELAAGEAEQRLALQLHARARGPGHAGEAPLRDALAEVLAAQGRWTEAADEHALALTLREEALGRWHPAVASSHHGLGVALLAAAPDRRGEAIEHLRAAVAIRERGLGPEHVRTIAARADLVAALEGT